VRHGHRHEFVEPEGLRRSGNYILHRRIRNYNPNAGCRNRIDVPSRLGGVNGSIVHDPFPRQRSDNGYMAAFFWYETPPRRASTIRK
jgi:hypothetical protein